MLGPTAALIVAATYSLRSHVAATGRDYAAVVRPSSLRSYGRTTAAKAHIFVQILRIFPKTRALAAPR